ncbi:MAG: hypothetical protein KAI74_01610 [Kiritimatiellae bacterium]|nr:hypothetical protein [Kiritimatiellia bacterium]
MADWQKNMDSFFAESDETKKNKDVTDFMRFVRDTAIPAFKALREQLEKHGRELSIKETASSVTARVSNAGTEELVYGVYGRLLPGGVLPYAEVKFRERNGLKIIKVESMIRSGESNYVMSDVKKQEVIDNFLDHYMRAIKPV